MSLTRVTEPVSFGEPPLSYDAAATSKLFKQVHVHVQYSSCTVLFQVVKTTP